jgi:hypothetical protein
MRNRRVDSERRQVVRGHICVVVLEHVGKELLRQRERARRAGGRPLRTARLVQLLKHHQSIFILSRGQSALLVNDRSKGSNRRGPDEEATDLEPSGLLAQLLQQLPEQFLAVLGADQTEVRVQRGRQRRVRP